MLFRILGCIMTIAGVITIVLSLAYLVMCMFGLYDRTNTEQIVIDTCIISGFIVAGGITINQVFKGGKEDGNNQK